MPTASEIHAVDFRHRHLCMSAGNESTQNSAPWTRTATSTSPSEVRSNSTPPRPPIGDRCSVFSPCRLDRDDELRRFISLPEHEGPCEVLAAVGWPISIASANQILIDSHSRRVRTAATQPSPRSARDASLLERGGQHIRPKTTSGTEVEQSASPQHSADGRTRLH